MKKPDLKKWFKRNEKEKTLWARQVAETLSPQVGATGDIEDIPRAERSPFKNIQRPPFEKRKVYRIGYLRTGKRVLAAILLFLNGLFFIGSTSVAWGFVFFGANCFVIIDYIWRTKHAKVDFDW